MLLNSSRKCLRRFRIQLRLLNSNIKSNFTAKLDLQHPSYKKRQVRLCIHFLHTKQRSLFVFHPPFRRRHIYSFITWPLLCEGAFPFGIKFYFPCASALSPHLSTLAERNTSSRSRRRWKDDASQIHTHTRR